VEKVFNMVTPTSFWTRFLERYYKNVNNIQTGDCIGPYILRDVAKELGFDDSRLKAPSIISLTTIDSLPKVLRDRGLYVVRLGQAEAGYASFILCRASPKYFNEVFWFHELLSKSDVVETIDKNAWRLLNEIGGEAIASSIALKTIIKRDNIDYIIPQYRGGSVVFEFKINQTSRNKYKYHGQVEIDAIALSQRKAYVVESKTFNKEGVFKYQLMFSMKSIEQKIGVEVCGVIAVYNSVSRWVKISFIKPCISRERDVAVNDLVIDKTYTYKLVLNHM